jgi:hypothetical protein
MGTRAIIKVKGSEVEMYRHSDGYPEGEHGVLAFLTPLVADFMADRGYDPSYFVARMVQAACNQYDANGYTDSKYLGFGCYSKQEKMRDIAYTYTVDLETGKIVVK